MKNNINNIDDDISRETRTEKSVTKSIIRPKWTGSDVIIPIKNKDNIIIVKKIEDTSVEEFASWLKQIMPFTPTEIQTYINRNVNSTREKIGLFETAVLLHARRWLFGLGEPTRSDASIRWS